MHEETATAADILKQIINDSLSTPPCSLPQFSSNYERPSSPTSKRRSWEVPTSPTSKGRTWSMEYSGSSPPKRRSWGECPSLPNPSPPNTPNWNSEHPLSPKSTSPVKRQFLAESITSPVRRTWGHGDPPSPRRRSNSILDDLKVSSFVFVFCNRL